MMTVNDGDGDGDFGVDGDGDGVDQQLNVMLFFPPTSKKKEHLV